MWVSPSTVTVFKKDLSFRQASKRTTLFSINVFQTLTLIQQKKPQSPQYTRFYYQQQQKAIIRDTPNITYRKHKSAYLPDTARSPSFDTQSVVRLPYNYAKHLATEAH